MTLVFDSGCTAQICQANPTLFYLSTPLWFLFMGVSGTDIQDVPMLPRQLRIRITGCPNLKEL